MFQIKAVEKIKTPILCSVTFSRKSYRLWENVEKIWYSRTGHRWQYKTAHAFCTPDTKSFRHIFRKCKTYRLSTAKIQSVLKF